MHFRKEKEFIKDKLFSPGGTEVWHRKHCKYSQQSRKRVCFPNQLFL